MDHTWVISNMQLLNDWQIFKNTHGYIHTKKLELDWFIPNSLYLVTLKRLTVIKLEYLSDNCTLKNTDSWPAFWIFKWSASVPVCLIKFRGLLFEIEQSCYQLWRTILRNVRSLYPIDYMIYVYFESKYAYLNSFFKITCNKTVCKVSPSKYQNPKCFILLSVSDGARSASKEIPRFQTFEMSNDCMLNVFRKIPLVFR